MSRRPSSSSRANIHSERAVHVSRSWFDECVVLCILVLLCLLAWMTYPALSHVQYRLGAGQYRDGTLPLSFDSHDVPEELSVSFRLSIPRLLRHTRFVIRGDDCVTSMKIDGVPLPSEILAPCRIDTPRMINLGQWLRPGTHEVIMEIRDTGGRMGIDFFPSLRDPLSLGLRVSVILMSLILCVLCALRFRESGWRVLFLLLALGVLLRLAYADVTPWDVRGNDAHGHREYIEYILDHGSIPPRESGWQFYQPPLWYVLSAIPFAGARALGLSIGMTMRWVQALSVTLSVGTLAAAFWCVSLLFPPEKRRERIIAAALIAFFPGYVLLAPKVNNDTLLHFLLLLSAGAVLRYWQRPTLRMLLLLSVILSSGILTKLNILPMLAVMCVSVLLQPTLPPWKRVAWLGCGLLLITSLTEWLFVFRMLQDQGSGGIVGNIANLNSGLGIDGGWRSMCIFDPLRVMQYPFNDPWQDIAGRGNFLEYLYRSAFFGEFSFPALRQLAQSMIVVGLFMGCLSLLGVVVGIRRSWKRTLPIVLILMITLIAHMAFRMSYPFATSQDFRYSPHLLLPLAYGYAALTTHASRHGRSALLILLSIFSLLSLLFVGGVWIIETAA